MSAPAIACICFIAAMLVAYACDKWTKRHRPNRYRDVLPAPAAGCVAGESWREHTPQPGRYADV